MKNFLTIFLIGSLLLTGIALAQETNAGLKRANGAVLVDAGLTPDNSFYFLDRFFENVGTFFTFGKVARAKRFLALAEERLAEVKKMAEKEDEINTKKAEAFYEEQLNMAITSAEDSKREDLIEKVSNATERHILILERVLKKVPKKTKIRIATVIKRAKNKSTSGRLRVLKTLANEKNIDRVAAPKKIQKNIKQHLKNAQRIRKKKVFRQKRILAICPSPLCAEAPPGCEYVPSNIKAPNGCLAYPCGKLECNRSNEDSVVFCSQQYSPVCGIDGKTYANRCIAENQNKIKVAYNGICK